MSITSVFVVGAGRMGSGIAQAMAQSGRKVFMYDITTEIVNSSKAKLVSGLQRMVDKGKMTAEDLQKVADAITPTVDMKLAYDCGLVIEAASENIDLKKKIIRQMDESAGPDAILATNTSSISITTLAGVTSRPEKFAGMHFFNPVHAMQLVEVVRGLRTSDETVEAVREIVLSLGKSPVVCKDSPGFVVNRLFDPMLNEAAFLISEGVATPEDVDTAMVKGLNHPMGPCALMDMIGIDVIYDVMTVMYNTFGDSKYRPAPLLRQMVDAGYLGKKSGRGFYDYGGKK